jgi:hypothetical protein
MKVEPISCTWHRALQHSPAGAAPFAASLSPPPAVLSGSAACKASSMLSQQTQQMLLAVTCTVFTS